MAAALGLPQRQDWTVDDLASLLRGSSLRVDRRKVDLAVPYRYPSDTREVFTTDVPFPVRLDLPVLTAQRRALLDRARPHG
jgi:hypothetical protein